MNQNSDLLDIVYCSAFCLNIFLDVQYFEESGSHNLSAIIKKHTNNSNNIIKSTTS